MRLVDEVVEEESSEVHVKQKTKIPESIPAPEPKVTPEEEKWEKPKTRNRQTKKEVAPKEPEEKSTPHPPKLVREKKLTRTGKSPNFVRKSFERR